MKNSPVHQVIIKTANEICKNRFMDYPEYDEDEPLTTIEECLTILVSEHLNHDTEIASDEIYDYFVSLLKNVKQLEQ